MKLLVPEFRNFAHHTPLLIWVADTTQNCVFVNSMWCKFTGLSEQEFLGNKWLQAIHPADHEAVNSAWNDAFEHRTAFSVEFRLLRHDGAERWMLSHGSPHFAPDGTFLGYIGTCVEIHTERELRERAERQQEQLARFFEKTPAMLFCLNAAGEIQTVSDRWLSHFEYTRKEVIGRQLRDFIPETTWSTLTQAHQQFFQTGQCTALQLQMVTKSGEIRDVCISSINETNDLDNLQKSIGIVEDITESQQRLKRLQKTQIAFDQSGEAIFWLSLDGQIRNANQHACASLEYSISELTNKWIWDIDPIYTKEKWEQLSRREQFAESQKFPIRSEHLSRTGRRFPVEIHAHVIVTEDESFICAFVRDLTETIQSDNELVHIQRRLEEALRSGNVGLWDWDMISNEVAFSAEWKTQIGLPPDTPLNSYQNWAERLHPDDRDAAIATVSSYLEGRSPQYISEFRFRHANGSYRWIRAQGRVFKNREGVPERMIGVHIDVTDHRHALRELANRTAELEAIFHASPDVFLRTDLQGTIRDYRINRNESILQLPPKSKRNRRIHEILPPKIAAIYDEAFVNLARTGQTQSAEYRILIDGRILWHQAIFVPFQEENVAIFIRDITDRKTSELGLIARTAELERSNADLDQFAYVASHDLKTPLRGIQHLTKWIREDCQGELPATCNEHLDRLDEQVKRMQSLLDDLLQFSRAGRLRVAAEPIDLSDMLDEIIGLVNPPPEIKITLEHEGMEITSGRAPLFHVLLNLVENAVKYHHRRNGHVRIYVREISDPEFVQFEVSDDGPGIDLEHHERVFRMFQRLDSRKTGSGMGLAVVRKTIESRGGSIQLLSNAGQGTTFYFTWPAMRDLPEGSLTDEFE